MLEGVQFETTESEINIFASSTCNLNINTFVHKKTVTNSVFVGNTTYADNETDSASSDGAGYGVIVPFGSYSEWLRSLNTSSLWASWQATEHTWCSVHVHVFGADGGRATA